MSTLAVRASTIDGGAPEGSTDVVTGGAACQFVRSELRRRAGSYVGLALVVALGAGVCLGSLVLAHRTDRAYPDYVRTAHVNPLVINPSLATDLMDAAIRDFDGVRSVHSNDLLLGSLEATRAFSISEVPPDDPEVMTQVLGSPDGRFLDVDRPVITEGRLPTGGSEIFVSEDFRAKFQRIVGHPVAIGDTVDMGFFPAGTFDQEHDPDELIQPLGVEHLRLVGYGHLSDEVLPDDVYPRERLIVSADVAQRYACTVHFEPDMTEDEAKAVMFGSPCATQYRYYSLDLEDGTTLADVSAEFQAAADRLVPELPPTVSGFSGYFYISQERRDLDDAVHQATRPAITALVAFGVVAGAATLVIFGLALARTIRRGERAQESLLALGATRRTRTVAAGGAALVAALTGLALAVVVGAALSLIGPLGSVRTVQRDVGLSLPTSVTIPVIVVLGIAVFIGVALAALAAAVRAERRAGRRTSDARGSRLGTRSGPPALALGVRAAIGDRRSGANLAVLGGCVVTVAVVVASAVFGSNLSAVVNAPSRYGWPWQVGVITGSGYGDANVDAIAATLDGRDDVHDYRLYNFDPSTRIDGRPVPVMFGEAAGDGTPLTVVSGRTAERSGEIVLGTRTAEELGVGVGDRVSLESVQFPETDATVVGTVVLPSVGSFVADKSGLGRGAFLPTAGDPDAAPSFVAVRLRDGADVDRFVDGIGPDLIGWDDTGQAPVVLRTVRPPEIVNIREMRGAPLLLAAILAAALSIGLAMAISVSVRERRRDLAILQALGFGSRSLGAAVRWQAVATIVVGLVAGVPLGIVAGRFAWRQFANELGLVPRANIPVVWLIVVAAGAVVLALAAAHRPGRNAARLSPAEVLRTQ
jgi:hypothetical protein